MMSIVFKRMAVLAVVYGIGAGAAMAGPIESACVRSDRAAASSGLCGCIQQVADFTLRSGDQRRIAGFFKDPEKAQTVKMSKSSSDDAFWERYTAFTAQAEAYCTAQ